jgi:hypothetical protein
MRATCTSSLRHVMRGGWRVSRRSVGMWLASRQHPLLLNHLHFVHDNTHRHAIVCLHGYGAIHPTLDRHARAGNVIVHPWGIGQDRTCVDYRSPSNPYRARPRACDPPALLLPRGPQHGEALPARPGHTPRLLGEPHGRGHRVGCTTLLSHAPGRDHGTGAGAPVCTSPAGCPLRLGAVTAYP